MQRSTGRILTTHVGSLVRTPEIMQGMKARVLGKPYDEAKFATDIGHGITDAVRKQVEIGIDIPNDGEFSRQGFAAYVNHRLSGLELRPQEPGETGWGGGDAAEQAVFPDFFAQYSSHFRYLWMHPAV